MCFKNRATLKNISLKYISQCWEVHFFIRLTVPVFKITWLLKKWQLFLVHFSDFLDPKQDLCIYFFENIICWPSFHCHGMICLLNPVDFTQSLHFLCHFLQQVLNRENKRILNNAVLAFNGRLSFPHLYSKVFIKYLSRYNFLDNGTHKNMVTDVAVHFS